MSHSHLEQNTRVAHLPTRLHQHSRVPVRARCASAERARTGLNTMSGLTGVDKKSVFSGGLPDANRNSVCNAYTNLEGYYALGFIVRSKHVHPFQET